MRNVLGTWRCVCEQDTARIHVMLVANRILELTIYMQPAPPASAVPAGMGIIELQPTYTRGVEVLDEHFAWYVVVEVCV